MILRRTLKIEYSHKARPERLTCNQGQTKGGQAMTTAITSPAPAPQGHCSQCGKIWTLAKDQGTCQWCGKQASCQQRRESSRTIKPRRKRKQASTGGNGYDQLPEPHLTYYRIASRFAYNTISSYPYRAQPSNCV